MKQSKLMSCVEICCNVGSGILIAWIVTLYFIPWMFDIEITHTAALEVTLVYTTVSLARGYIWRRLFNGR